MIYRFLVLCALAGAVSGCGASPVFSAGSGDGPGPSTRIASITTAAEHQVRPRRVGDRVGFATSIGITGAKGYTFERLEIDAFCLSI